LLICNHSDKMKYKWKNKTIICEKHNVFETEAIYSVDSEFLKGKTITSMYLPDYNLILFNQDWLSVAKFEEVILTAFHETRHAYQKAQIDGIPNLKQSEEPETIAKWKHEFEEYYRPSEDYQDDSEYLEQEIEKDAISFSEICLRELD